MVLKLVYKSNEFYFLSDNQYLIPSKFMKNVDGLNPVWMILII